MIAVSKLLSKPVCMFPVSTESLKLFVRTKSASTVKLARSMATRAAVMPKTTARKARVAAKRQSKKAKPLRKNVWVALYVLAALAASQSVLLMKPLLGVYVTAVVLVALLALSLKSEPARKLAIASAVLPTTMLVAISLPQTDAFARSAVFYDSLLLFALLYGYTFTISEPRSALSLGKKYIVFVPLMIVSGQALGALGFGMLRHTYPYHGISLYLVASTAVVFAIAEELLFRGLIQQQAAKVMHPVVAAIVATLAYAIVFISHGSFLPALFALVSGAVLSGVYYFKPNLILTTTLNAVMKVTYIGLLATFVLH